MSYVSVTAQPIQHDGSVGFDERGPLEETSTTLEQALIYIASRIAEYPDYTTWDLTIAIDPTAYCQWFAACRNAASTTRQHPVLGNVPICKRCNDKVEALS